MRILPTEWNQSSRRCRRRIQRHARNAANQAQALAIKLSRDRHDAATDSNARVASLTLRSDELAEYRGHIDLHSALSRLPAEGM
jgi:hypothetical protein